MTPAEVVVLAAIVLGVAALVTLGAAFAALMRERFPSEKHTRRGDRRLVWAARVGVGIVIASGIVALSILAPATA